MNLFRGPGRGHALARFVLAIAFFIVAQYLANQAAQGFTLGAALPLTRNLFQLFLEIIGFGYMGLAFDKNRQPLQAMGFVSRPGQRFGQLREFALGAALGWGMMVSVALVLAFAGTLYVHFWWTPRAFLLLAMQLGTLAAGALAGEMVFRGYPFQKLIEAFGSFTATVLACLFFGLLRMASPDAGTAGIWVSGIAALLLSLAYLRTRALWLPWGIHFAWLASMGMLFGLPIAGNTDGAIVVQTTTYGSRWMTGGDYGPEAGWLAFLALLVGVYVLLRITRQLAWQVNQPELKPAGIPVDIPHRAPASPVAPAVVSIASQVAPTTTVPSLIQIAPGTPMAAPAVNRDKTENR